MKGLKLIVACLMAVACDAALANCTTNSAVASVFQCGFLSWWAPPPVGIGQMSSVWWQLGYGNARVTAAPGTVFTDDLQGTGIGPAGLFSGNDSGSFYINWDFANDPRALGGHPQAALIPNGARCANYQNSWGGYGVDGCVDNPRTPLTSDNDNILNPYFNPLYGAYPANYTLDQQIDYPMAFLMRESTGRFFAAAFLATRVRGASPDERAYDASEGFFNLGEISNGDVNPITAERDIIPWQPVPRPLSIVPMDIVGTAPVDVIVAWNEMRVVSDQSVRPSSRGLVNPGGGVGVLDQGPLCRYQLQEAPNAIAGGLLTWSDIGPEFLCGSGTGGVMQTIIRITAGTGVRVRTRLGKQPRTSSTALADARVGALGDLGFEATRCDGLTAATCPVSPPMLVFGGPLVAEQAVDTVATRNRNAVLVTFRTTSELTVTGIEILGRLDHLLKSIPPKNGTNGAGASYELLLTPAELRGSKELRIRLVGPDTTSPPFGIQ